jgi:hypothetical protein
MRSPISKQAWWAGLVCLGLLVPCWSLGQDAGSTDTGSTTLRAGTSGRKGGDPALAQLQAAVRELTDEALQALQPGSQGWPRATCNYFEGAAAGVLSEPLLVMTLSQPIHPDPRVTAYVRWQLLSGLPSPISLDFEKEAVAALVDAPRVPPRYGLENSQRRELEKRLQRTRQDGLVELNRYLSDQLGAAGESSKPLFQYRNELYRRIPPSAARFIAGAEDLEHRLSMGWDVRDEVKGLQVDIRSWASGSPPAAHLIEVSKALGRLAKAASPRVIVEARLNPTSRMAEWRTMVYRAERDGKLSTLAAELLEQSRRPGAGQVQFRDPDR